MNYDEQSVPVETPTITPKDLDNKLNALKKMFDSMNEKITGMWLSITQDNQEYNGKAPVNARVIGNVSLNEADEIWVFLCNALKNVIIEKSQTFISTKDYKTFKDYIMEIGLANFPDLINKTPKGNYVWKKKRIK